ncbi:serine/threonine-protein kinase [Amycolatopsis sp. Poz14]|uniref:serine/threonine-protein kinase n=1 Tax=Amycolatopsis sp. Poz14 TaxID=1447705 RepID=UPI001EE904EE|nr:serine/threonine-protein kinase [Amycolatopsis sp. Poz14]MCG3753145.1 protein kinase [Amycolatopsis sp. Poz14]
MTACARPNCSGTISRAGFCAKCGWAPGSEPKKPPPKADATLVIPAPGASRIADTVVTREQQTAGHGTGDDYIPLPVVVLPDIAGRVLADPHVAEDERYCGKRGCGAPVGRSAGGRPARTEGFCSQCGTPFSFSPKLFPDDVVDGRYQVHGCIARGGLGYVYLGTDLRLKQYVALKGLLNTGDEAAVRIAETESQVLTSLDHPNIVRIHDVATHPDPHGGPDARYIVMEFVDGLPLAEVMRRGRAMLDGPEGKLLVEHVVAYGREILTALGYLHEQGLLYCDLSPQNVIHGEKRVKLIDFGAIRKIGDQTSPIVGNPRFQIGATELDEHGLTVRSDIHTVGATLRDLFRCSDGWPRPADKRIALGVESFTQVLDRATGPYEHRFATTGEMLVQLDGVLHEILSLRDRQSRPSISTLFTEAAVLLDAGLGQPRPVGEWVRRARRTAGPLGALPAPLDIALGLPVPHEDPHDPAVAFLRTVRAPDPARLLKKLERADSTVEVELRRCRAWLELSEADSTGAEQAARRVDAAEKLLGARAKHDWRIAWHRGLVALAAGAVESAQTWFERVHRDIPGEETPKLALGLCAEHCGGPKKAARYYDALWVRDHLQVNAVFGLARGHLQLDERTAAVELLDQVPEYSRHDEAARIAGIRVRAGILPVGDALPDIEDLAEAIDRLSALEVDRDTADRLTAEVRESALRCFLAGMRGMPPGPVLGERLDEHGLRLLVEQSYRRIARRAGSAEYHDALVDRANETRPTTWV